MEPETLIRYIEESLGVKVLDSPINSKLGLDPLHQTHRLQKAWHAIGHWCRIPAAGVPRLYETLGRSLQL